MKDSHSSYKMLLGRPWFRQARVKQDWGEYVVILRKGKKSVTISMQGRKQIPPKIKPLFAQTINLADVVEDDEEEEFLRANPTIVHIFEVDIEEIIQKEEEQGEDEVKILLDQEIAGSKVLQMMDQNLEVPQKMQIDQEEKEARIMAKKIYEKRKGVVLKVDVSNPEDKGELLAEEEVAPMSSSKMLQSLMEPFSDCKVEIDCQADRNEKWLKATGLYDFATLPWGQWKGNIYAKIQMELLRKTKGAISKKVCLIPRVVAQVFQLPFTSVTVAAKCSDEDLKKEFGPREGDVSMILESKSLRNQEMAVSEGKEDAFPKPKPLQEVIRQECDFEAQMTKITRNLTRRLANWVLLIKEFDYEVIHRPKAQHAVANYLSRLDSGEPPMGIVDEFLDAPLFLIGVVADLVPLEQSAWMIPNIPWTWYKEMFHFLDSADMLLFLSRRQCHQMAICSRNVEVIMGKLYYCTMTDVLLRYVLPQEQESILEEVHTGIVGGHFATLIMARKVLQAGLW
ncbi:hypothetical protein L7F22_028047 [Adiantum nelumboides]|nr:hypothetical protein [Adiantum nelumboides]